MGNFSLEDRERGQPEGERAMQVYAVQAQRAISTRKRSERKRQGIKEERGGENQRGEKDGGRGKVRGGEEKASRKGDRGEEERPANGDYDSNTEKGERGRGGTGEEREGSVHCQKIGRSFGEVRSEQVERERSEGRRDRRVGRAERQGGVVPIVTTSRHRPFSEFKNIDF
jgi:hypothetical protein